MSVETNADEVAESAPVQEFLGNVRLVGCSSARDTKSVAMVQDGT